MAASILGNVRTAAHLSHRILHPFRQNLKSHAIQSTGIRHGVVLPSYFCRHVASVHDGDAVSSLSKYQDRPSEYLESEEYFERYRTETVWNGYRRNHKGGIPPQKTRKTCIRGDKISGNPCPVCRDPNIIVHYQNVKLLQQFISPQTGMVFDPTRTGVCMKQQKKLNEAVDTARNHGLLPSHIPPVEFSAEDYSTSHDAVGSTPSLPSTLSDTWYKWYGTIEPDENEVAKVKKTYAAYLK
ncbi:small ribosomal subunit protein mS40 isoform X2 [Nelusetta ayraudi]|uniref:small ribosomal subunit protein mS40 isoform X2 n=1 Tax=Nelusetta ayraudi TaxID=303726 RepID=UPI003F6EF307